LTTVEPRHAHEPDQELQWLRRRHQADQATIDVLTATLLKLRRAARALKEENDELRRTAAVPAPAAPGKVRGDWTVHRYMRTGEPIHPPRTKTR
jgi:hypothetical protein